jgi:hypothetical protein
VSRRLGEGGQRGRDDDELVRAAAGQRFDDRGEWAEVTGAAAGGEEDPHRRRPTLRRPDRTVGPDRQNAAAVIDT